MKKNISKVSYEHFLELFGKKEFVECIGVDCCHCQCGSILALTYEVFEYVNTEHELIQEYLVVTYRGGAKTYRSCNMNSLSAILKEISKLANGGYYDELEDYKNISTSDKWIQIV